MKNVITNLVIPVGVVSSSNIVTLPLYNHLTCRRVLIVVSPIAVTGTGNAIVQVRDSVLGTVLVPSTESIGTSVLYFSMSLGGSLTIPAKPIGTALTITRSNPSTGTASYNVICVEEYDDFPVPNTTQIQATVETNLDFVR